MSLAAILLAAGASRRFGDEDKLLAPYRGVSLVSHAAQALRGVAPDLLIAVTTNPDVADLLDGFRIATPDVPAPPQSASLAAGVRRAAELGADTALIVLGDMPNVSAELLRAVADRCAADPTAATAATDGDRVLPPCCFPRHQFDALLTMRGDTGARALLRGLPPERLVMADPKELIDIDTPDDLLAAERA